MATNEKEDVYNVQGYIKAGMIVLHSELYDHDDNNGLSVYIPRLFVINPEQICTLEKIKIKKRSSNKISSKNKSAFY